MAYDTYTLIINRLRHMSITNVTGGRSYNVTLISKEVYLRMPFLFLVRQVIIHIWDIYYLEDCVGAYQERDHMEIKNWAGWKGWARDISIALIIGIIILQFIRPIIVQEHSMEPTLLENDYLFLSKQAYRFAEPKRGDIVVFHTDLKDDRGRDKYLIKRIIGLPGDTIGISDGIVYRNGSELKEDYTMDGLTAGDMEEVTVPEGHIFVMGDNRNRSMDSRDPSIGCVSTGEILGKVIFQVFPPSRFGKP